MKMEYKNESCPRQHNHSAASTGGKIFWGLLIIGGALLLIFNALGYKFDGSVPVLSVIGSIILLAIAISSLSKFKFVLFFIPLALIALIWESQISDLLQLPEGYQFKVWPLLGAAVLLGIGFSVLFHRRSHVHVEIGGDSDASIETLNSDESVDIDVSWGDHIKYVHAGNLKRATVKSNFASTKVYFDQCTPGGNNLEINVNCSFSELVLNVPRDWAIDSRISTFAGEVKSMPPVRTESKVQVALTGSVNFAELRINYV